MTKNKTLSKLKLNKDLTIGEKYKELITSAEFGRYEYYDFSKEKISEIAKKDLRKEVKVNDANRLVQALFPDKLICSGIFDSFLMFNIKNSFRVDPPKYYYSNLISYLNNDRKSKCNFLLSEIIDLFKKNNITYHESWDELLKISLTEETC